MGKRILDVGNCGPDHQSIRRFFERNFDAHVDQTDAAEDTLAALRASHYDLVVVNRKLDVDYSDGLELIKQIKADEQLAAVPVMLVTNFPEHQQQAVAAGSLYGFGKLELENPEVIDRVRSALEEGAVPKVVSETVRSTQDHDKNCVAK